MIATIMWYHFTFYSIFMDTVKTLINMFIRSVTFHRDGGGLL